MIRQTVAKNLLMINFSSSAGFAQIRTLPHRSSSISRICVICGFISHSLD